jgi:hypothetical protein
MHIADIVFEMCEFDCTSRNLMPNHMQQRFLQPKQHLPAMLLPLHNLPKLLNKLFKLFHSVHPSHKLMRIAMRIRLIRDLQPHLRALLRRLPNLHLPSTLHLLPQIPPTEIPPRLLLHLPLPNPNLRRQHEPAMPALRVPLSDLHRQPQLPVLRDRLPQPSDEPL